MASLARTVFLCATLLLVVAGCSWAGPGATPVTVMTRNMDAGTDLKLALAYLFTDNPTFGIDLTYQEILQSNFAGRAKLLAQEIAAIKPDLVSLQEVTTWSTGPAPYSLTPKFDQLQLLMSELGGEYFVVAQNDLLQTALPMSNGTWLGMKDSDVVLARSGVNATGSGKRYSTFLTIPDPFNIPVPQGWIEVNVSVGGKTFKFVDTHLQSPFPGEPEISLIQEAQAAELAAALAGTGPVVVAGDFNSNATHTPPEQTQAYGIMLSAGFTDAWSALMHGNPGFTWPMFVEDPPAGNPKGPLERIDFIFVRGLEIESVARIGWKAPHASDHAGVAAVLVP